MVPPSPPPTNTYIYIHTHIHTRALSAVKTGLTSLRPSHCDSLTEYSIFPFSFLFSFPRLKLSNLFCNSLQTTNFFSRKVRHLQQLETYVHVWYTVHHIPTVFSSCHIKIVTAALLLVKPRIIVKITQRKFYLDLDETLTHMIYMFHLKPAITVRSGEKTSDHKKYYQW